MVSVFFNSSIVYRDKNILERLGDGCFRPLRYLCQGTKITLWDKKIIDFKLYGTERHWFKTAAAIIVLIPLLPLGILLKGVASLSSVVREHREIGYTYLVQGDVRGELDQNVREFASKINWLHGTNSALLPVIAQTKCTLAPTGRLLENGVGPMGGEISMGGMMTYGVNQNYISVDTIEGLTRCWNYAANISHTFQDSRFRDADSFFCEKLENLERITPDKHSWDPILVSLYQFKQWNPEEFKAISQKYSERIRELTEKLQHSSSTGEKLILKALEYDLEKLKLVVSDVNVRTEIEKEFPPVTLLGDPNWYMQGTTIDSFINDCENRLDFNDFGDQASKFLIKVIELRIYEQEKIQKRIEKHKVKESASLNPSQDADESIIKEFYYNRMTKYVDIDNPNIDDTLKNLLSEKLEARIASNTVPYARRLNRLERLFSDEPFIKFTKIDSQYITQPFPLVLASTKSKSFGARADTENHVVKATFGEEIDLVFVPESALEQMENWIDAQGLKGRVSVISSSLVKSMKKIRVNSDGKTIAAM